MTNHHEDTAVRSVQALVGRETEIRFFVDEVLGSRLAQVVLVADQAGMGKTALLDKFAELAAVRPVTGCVRYEVAPSDPVDSILALMIDHAYDAAGSEPGSLDRTDQRLRQWHALLNLLPQKAKQLHDLMASLKRDPTKSTRTQFTERIKLISSRLPDDGRAVFLIDPEKYLDEKSVDAWRLVAECLPEKVKLVFAQRPDDSLVCNNDFLAIRRKYRCIS